MNFMFGIILTDHILFGLRKTPGHHLVKNWPFQGSASVIVSLATRSPE